jgi:diguanylate cyclase (GGDEF)-like protein
VGLLYLEGCDPAAGPDLQMLAETIALALANLRLRETLRNQSIRDPLTGLFNRRYLDESLDLDVARSARAGGALGVIMLDVDHFKRFNDLHGHDAGDAVLQEMGKLLSQHVRKGDVACRYGGEEFVLVLPGATAEQARARAETLRAAAQAMTLSHKGQALGAVTVSLGVAAFPDHGNDPKVILTAADAALYAAKRAGRNRIEIAGAALVTAA